MTLLIACILLWQYDWPWYWYPIAAVIWLFHEYQLHMYFRELRTLLQRIDVKTDFPRDRNNNN